MVNNIMMSEKTCFDARSLSSIQNQLLRYFTDTKASGGLDGPLWILTSQTTPGTSLPCSNPG